MKPILRIFTTLAVVTLCAASAQDVRSFGMGGVLLPGLSLAAFNPAYASYPADQWGRGGGINLPVGLINFFVRPQMKPFPTNQKGN